MTTYLLQIFIYLIAAVIAVPIAKRLGLGSILGYLIAGIVIGPIIGLVDNAQTDAIQHFAEFGVVMMLFLVRLEMDPQTLWRMRNRLIGLGGLQLSLTTLIITLIAIALNQAWQSSIALGLILSLSSTAIVLQSLKERNLSSSQGGRNAFSVLLFQDLAFIPMLTLIPLSALPSLQQAGQHLQQELSHSDNLNLVAGLPDWLYVIVIALTMVAIGIGGHYLTRPIFRFISSAKQREIFTATALLLVVGISVLMGLVGLSPALGTFYAGVLLANSEFRHELEANIDPFKGLLLGLFFITVGADIDFSLLWDNFFTLISLTILLMLVKIAVLFILAFIFKLNITSRWLFTLSLAQAGEFGFVLLGFAAQNSVLSELLAQQMAVVVALSMLLTPLLFIIFDKVITPMSQRKKNEQQSDDEIDSKGHVIIAGAGRFGQVVNRLLVSNDIPTTVLDYDSDMIDSLRTIKVKSYFGDVSRPELLHTAGIEEAEILVLAIDSIEVRRELIKHVKHAYPKVKILSRAFDRSDYYAQLSLGADFVIVETFYSALETGTQAMKTLNFHPYEVEKKKYNYLDVENENNQVLYEAWKKQHSEENTNNDDFIEIFLELENRMRSSMKHEKESIYLREEQSWTPIDNLENEKK